LFLFTDTQGLRPMKGYNEIMVLKNKNRRAKIVIFVVCEEERNNEFDL